MNCNGTFKKKNIARLPKELKLTFQSHYDYDTKIFVTSCEKSLMTLNKLCYDS